MHLLLSDLYGQRRGVQKPEPDVLRGKLFIWFQQWVHIFQRSSTPEKSFIPFITQLTKQGVLKVEDLSSLFFRVCAEASVEGYHKNVRSGNVENPFQSLDACSRLIVYIIKYHGDASGVNNDQAKVHYLTKILSIFVLVLASLHEDQGADFQQKPFFRFFSSLINDLHYMEANFGTAYLHLMIAIRYSSPMQLLNQFFSDSDAVTPSAPYNPPSSPGSHFRGCALSLIECSCRSCSSLKTERYDCFVFDGSCFNHRS